MGPASLQRRSAAPACARSSVTALACLPVCSRIAVVAACKAASSRATSTGSAPSRAKATAHARPMPFEAPVMSTRLPANCKSM
ncbi:hypothetical protein D3C87_651930 [compost metagenome]